MVSAFLQDEAPEKIRLLVDLVQAPLGLSLPPSKGNKGWEAELRCQKAAISLLYACVLGTDNAVTLVQVRADTHSLHENLLIAQASDRAMVSMVM